MRVLFAGGGTGGHIFPLIAIVRALKPRAPHDAEFFFLGPPAQGIDLLTKEGVAVRSLITGKIPRYFTFSFILELIKIPLGMIQAIVALWRIMPDVVFGKGGYGMVPTVIAAWLFRIPVVIHESDSLPGFSTRIAARFAKSVGISFPEMASVFPHARLVGNPVRKTMATGSAARAQARWHLSLRQVVLVLGGSQGAWELNSMVVTSAPALLKDAEIILQCGTKTAHATRLLMQKTMAQDPDLFSFLHIEPFLEEELLADAYAAATVVISRAGSSTLFENALVAKPMILVPLVVGAANKHQETNAEIFARAGAAEIISRQNLAPHLFATRIHALLNDPVRLQTMAQAARKLARPNAADDTATLILEAL